jgi:hypothetical protein
MFKFIQDAIPFVAPYPIWVKWLLCVWALLSLITLGALVLVRPATATEKPAVLYLTIRAVEFAHQNPDLRASIRLTAYVNDTAYTYPSLAGVRWAEIGPTMSEQSFRLSATEPIKSVRF